MTDRERWTIYPLLFLALALALRDKIFPATPASLVARQLTIVRDDGRPSIALQGGDSKGASPVIQVLNAAGQTAWLLVVAGQNGAAIETTGTLMAREVRVIGPDGKRRLLMGVTGDQQSAGRAEWYDGGGQLLMAAGGGDIVNGVLSTFRDGKPQFNLGSNDRGGMMLLRSADGQPYLLLTPDEKGIGRGLLFDNEGNGQLILAQPIPMKLNEVHPHAPPTADSKTAPVDQPAAKADEESEKRPAPTQPDAQAPAAPESEGKTAAATQAAPTAPAIAGEGTPVTETTTEPAAATESPAEESPIEQPGAATP